MPETPISLHLLSTKPYMSVQNFAIIKDVNK